jgi:hypothetical protein
MHWIVSSSLSREGGYFALVDQLERQKVPFTLVRKPPMVPHLVAMDDPGRPITLDEIEGPVYVVGTTTMKQVSLDHGWTPGYVDAPTQEQCVAAWGDHMLNATAVFGALGRMSPPPGERFFVRPDEGSKAFGGRIVEADRFEEWRRDLTAPDAPHPVDPDQRVMIAPMRAIWSEYRCIVVDGRFVTGSRYRTGRTVAYSPDVGARIVRFVNERVAEWNPRIALCIDVADTPDGLKIIETNDVSSAGFYAIDMSIYVGEIGRALG